MNNILESILNHLKMNNTGALLVTGKWGSGKTYYLKNEVLPYVKENTGFTPVIVSLYGEENRAGVAKKIIYGFLDSKSGVSDFSFQKVASWISKAAPYIPKIKDYVDLSKILEGSGENFLKFLPHNKILIVLDDLERKSESLQMSDLFGLINDIVENFGAKVLLIANEEKIEKSELEFKEKTIEKTLEFTPDLSNVFDSLFENYQKSLIGQFLNSNKDFFLNSLLIQSNNPIIDDEIKNSFSNIRTLKFALEHFKSVCEILTGSKPSLSDLEIEQLKNIWVFILSVSAEFKANKLSLSDRKDIDKQATVAGEFDFDFSDFVEDSDNSAETEVDFSIDFKEKYFSRLGEQYIFYPEIYEFIIGGFSIDKESFIASLNDKFHIKEEGNGVKEPYSLLNDLMRGWWQLTGEQFIGKLKLLLGFVEKGEFDDSLSYINSGNFLFEYSNFLGLEAEGIKEKIETGLKLSIGRCEFVFKDKTTLEMVGDQFKRPELVNLISLAKNLLDQRQEELNASESNELIELFNENFVEFVSRFIGEAGNNTGKYGSNSFLDKISEEDLESFIKNISLPEVGQLDHLIASRYLRETNLYIYLREIIFLENLNSNLGELNPVKDSIEWHVLNKMVWPKIKAAIGKFRAIRISVAREME